MGNSLLMFTHITQPSHPPCQVQSFACCVLALYQRHSPVKCMKIGWILVFYNFIYFYFIQECLIHNVAEFLTFMIVRINEGIKGILINDINLHYAYCFSVHNINHLYMLYLLSKHSIPSYPIPSHPLHNSLYWNLYSLRL